MLGELSAESSNGEAPTGDTTGLLECGSEKGSAPCRACVKVCGDDVGVGYLEPPRYGGGAVEVLAFRFMLFAAAAAMTLPARMPFSDCGCVEVPAEIASRYAGATSSADRSEGGRDDDECRFRDVLLMLPVCRDRILFVLEYRLPINSSVSKENTRRCRVHLFLFLS